MTGSPLPSDRLAIAKAAALWSALFAIGVAGSTSIVVAQLEPLIASIVPPVDIVLPSAEPAPPVATVDFERLEAIAPSGIEVAGGERYELTLTLQGGDTIERMLADIDVPEAERQRVGQALAALLGDRRLASGEPVNLVVQDVPRQPGILRVVSLVVRPEPQREFVVSRRDDGSFAGEEKAFRLTSRFVRTDATLSVSILDSGTRAGAPAAAVSEFIKALSYDVDFQRELREGQRISLLLEQLVTSDGKVSDQGRLMAGELILANRVVSVVRFRPERGADQFYNLQGESVARPFLRTPLALSTITSPFGLREHPLLGFTAMHSGVDFGAPMGTPVLAAASGTVKLAAVNGGLGLFVKLEHSAQVGTGYGHLSRLGPGIRPGAIVRQGQVIGFVGSTGTSTGPHLHYEFYRSGKAVNPLAERSVGQTSLRGQDLILFQTVTREYINLFKTAPRLLEPVPMAQTPAPPTPSPVLPSTASPAVPAAMESGAPTTETPRPVSKPKPAKRASKPSPPRSGAAASSG